MFNSPKPEPKKPEPKKPEPKPDPVVSHDVLHSDKLSRLKREIDALKSGETLTVTNIEPAPAPAPAPAPDIPVSPKREPSDG